MFPYPFEVSNSCLNGNKPWVHLLYALAIQDIHFLIKLVCFLQVLHFFTDCPLFKFGTNCNNACVCDQSKSLSCDKHTGECLCKNGWTGVKCSCREKTECGENSFCEGSNCFCNDGVLNKPTDCSG